MKSNFPATRLLPAAAAILAVILAFGGCALPPVDSASAGGMAASEQAAAPIPAEATPLPAETAASEPATVPEPKAAFEQQLADALAAGDVDELQSLMADPFRLSVFESEGRIIPAEEAAGELRDLYLTEGATPLIEKQVDLESLLGADPLSIWGEDAPMADALFVSGLGGDALGEAVLAIAEEQPGEFAWAGGLFAPEGFGGRPFEAAEEVSPEAPAEAATEEETPADAPAQELATEIVRIVTVVRMTNVYPEPDPDVAPAGLLRRGDQFVALGEDDSGEYLQIDCREIVADACWVVNDPGAVEVTEETVVVEQDTPEAESAPEAEATPVAPLAEEPAPEALEAEIDVADAEEIVFEGMNVAATVTGRVTAEEPAPFTVRAKAGQAMTVDVVSEENIANFSIIGLANGQPYKRIVNEDRVFVFTVPVTQDYVITVESPADSDFALTVVLPPQGPQASSGEEPVTPEADASAGVDASAEEDSSAEQAAVPGPGLGAEAAAGVLAADTNAVSVEDATRLSLDEGETSLTLVEIMSPEGADQYVLRAVNGQTMDVSVDSVEEIANFSVVSARDGRTLKSADSEERSWSGTLPATGDYLVTVYNSRPVRVQYTLQVAFSPLSEESPDDGDQPAEDEIEAERIEFAPGATSEFVSGSVDAGEVMRYVLEASAGQTMSISFYPTGPATFSVAGADGEVLKSSGAGASFWSGELPTDQDYYVAVVSEEGDIQFDFIIEVTD